MTWIGPKPPDDSTTPFLPSSTERQNNITARFKKGGQPLETTLAEPREVSFKEASAAFLDPLKLADIPKEVDPVKQKKFQAIRKTASNVAQFARGRPTTCALLLVGLAFLLIAVPALGLSLVGIGGITVAHVAIPLGLMFTVVMSYYGWAFINMAKHSSNAAKMQEIFKQWGIDQTKLSRPPLKSERIVVLQAGQKEIDKLHEEYETQRVEAEKALKESLNTRKKLEKTRDKLETSLTKAPSEATATLLTITQEAIEGAQETLSTIPKLVLVDFETEIDISRGNSKNVKKKDNILKQFKNFVVEHPLATGLLTIGIVTLAVALPVSIYFFAGFTSITIIGSLSAILIPQLIVYGLSFLYEAKNSLNIDRHKQFLEKHKPIQEVLTEFYGSRKEFIEQREKEIEHHTQRVKKEEAKARETKIRAEEKIKHMASLNKLMSATLHEIAPNISPEAYETSVNEGFDSTTEGAVLTGIGITVNQNP